MNSNTGIYWNGTEYRYVKDGKDIGGIDSMPAGTEMDALVAERVMGCKPEPWLDSHGYKSYRCTCLLSYPHNSQTGPMADLDLKSYSNDIAAAWEVVEKISLLHNWDLFPNEWKSNYSLHTLCFVIYDGTTSYTGKGSTAALSICRAALKAVMK